MRKSGIWARYARLPHFCSSNAVRVGLDLRCVCVLRMSIKVRTDIRVNMSSRGIRQIRVCAELYDECYKYPHMRTPPVKPGEFVILFGPRDKRGRLYKSAPGRKPPKKSKSKSSTQPPGGKKKKKAVQDIIGRINAWEGTYHNSEKDRTKLLDYNTRVEAIRNSMSDGDPSTIETAITGIYNDIIFWLDPVSELEKYLTSDKARLAKSQAESRDEQDTFALDARIEEEKERVLKSTQLLQLGKIVEEVIVKLGKLKQENDANKAYDAKYGAISKELKQYSTGLQEWTYPDDTQEEEKRKPVRRIIDGIEGILTNIKSGNTTTNAKGIQDLLGVIDGVTTVPQANEVLNSFNKELAKLESENESGEEDLTSEIQTMKRSISKQTQLIELFTIVHGLGRILEKLKQENDAESSSEETEEPIDYDELRTRMNTWDATDVQDGDSVRETVTTLIGQVQTIQLAIESDDEQSVIESDIKTLMSNLVVGFDSRTTADKKLVAAKENVTALTEGGANAEEIQEAQLQVTVQEQMLVVSEIIQELLITLLDLRQKLKQENDGQE